MGIADEARSFYKSIGKNENYGLDIIKVSFFIITAIIVIGKDFPVRLKKYITIIIRLNIYVEIYYIDFVIEYSLTKKLAILVEKIYY